MARAGVIALLAAGAFGRNNLARTPPMGWMSWQVFRCNLNTSTDDCTDPATTGCISQALYEGQADAMVANGFAASGYDSIHMDDCWEQQTPPRDPVTNELRADFVRFPAGMKALGDYIHQKGLGFAIYTAESTETCGGYPASQGYEVLDAETFATWGVGESILRYDYCMRRVPRHSHCPILRLHQGGRLWRSVFGQGSCSLRRGRGSHGKLHASCADPSYYPTGYSAMGAALEATGRDITYSCSWPAYIGTAFRRACRVHCESRSLGHFCRHTDTAGDNETQKPFGTFVMDGCNLWRNW